MPVEHRPGRKCAAAARGPGTVDLAARAD